MNATKTTSDVYINGAKAPFNGYNINGSNYFKLRDVGSSINFGISWDGSANTISVDTKVNYTPE